jgi:hypothetical protein
LAAATPALTESDVATFEMTGWLSVPRAATEAELDWLRLIAARLPRIDQEELSHHRSGGFPGSSA